MKCFENVLKLDFRFSNRSDVHTKNENLYTHLFTLQSNIGGRRWSLLWILDSKIFAFL